MGLLTNLWDEDLFVSIGTKAKEAALQVAEPYLPPPPDPEPYQWQEPLNLDQGMWTDPLPMPEWTPPEEFPTEWDAAQGGFTDLFSPAMEPTPQYQDAPQLGGFDGLWSDPTFADELSMWQMARGGNPFADVSWAPPEQGYVTPAPAPALFDFGPQDATPIDFGQWDSMPVPGAETAFAGPPSPPAFNPDYNPEVERWRMETPEAYSLNLGWSPPVPAGTDWFGETKYYADPQTGYGYEPSNGAMGVNGNETLGLNKLWDGYNRVQNAFAETGLDLTPAVIDAYSGQGLNDLLGGGFLGNTAERLQRQMLPGTGIVGLGSDIAELTGLYKPGTGYDDAAGTGRNLFESKGNLWDFAGQQSEDLGERPLAEQIVGQVLFDPTNIVGGGWLNKMDDVPDWLRAADYGIDAVQSAPFKAIGGGRFLDELSGPIGRQLGGEAGEASAKLAGRLGLTAAGGAIGYATGDTEEERLQRAALGASLTGVFANADMLAKGYGAGVNFLSRDTAKKVRFGVDPLASRDHMWTDQILPIPKIDVNESLTPGEKLTNVGRSMARRVQDVPGVKDAFEALNLLHGKSMALTDLITGTLSQTLDDAAIRIDPATGRALTRDGNFMPVFKTGQKGIDAGALDAGALDNVVTTNVIDNAADWADVAEQWWKYRDGGYIDDEQVAALRKVDEVLGRIKAQQEAMGIKKTPDRPLWNYAAPEGESSLYFPRGVPESQNDPLVPLKGENSGYAKVFGKEPGTSKEAVFETAGENIVNNNRRYPPLDQRIAKYVSGELDETARYGVLSQIVDIPLGVSMKGADGQPQALTLGDVLFNGKDRMAELRKEIAPIDRAIRTERARANVYTRSAGIGQDAVDRLSKMLEEAQAPYGDVNKRTVQAASTVVKDEAVRGIDDAMAVITSANDMWRTAAKEGDAIRKSQIEQAPGIKEELDQLRKQLREAKKGLMQNEEDFAWNRAEELLGQTGAPTYDTVVLEATRDMLQKAVILRDSMLKADRLAAPEGVLADMKKADSLKAFGERMQKTGVKRVINMAEEIGQMNRALGKVQAIQKELATVSKAQELTKSRATTHLQKVIAAVEEVAPLHKERSALIAAEEFATQARRAVKDAGATGTVNVGGLMNIDLPQDIATTANRALDSFFNKQGGIHVVSALNKIWRPFMTTADASFAGTTGTAMMFDDPKTWAKGVGQGLESMVPKIGRSAEGIEKQNYERWSQMLGTFDDLPSMDSLITRYGLQVSPSELAITTARGDTFSKAVSERRPLAAFGQLPVVKQANDAFTVSGNTYRAEHAVKGLIDARIRNGEPLTPDTINSIVTAANTVGGRASRGFGESVFGLNNPLNPKQVGDIWFAGRFTQSKFDLLGNAILNGNLEGDLARQTLLRMATGGMMFTLAANEALGNPTELNPLTDDGRLNPNWMRVRVLGHDISPFGAYDALAKSVLATTLAPEKGGDIAKQFFRNQLSPAMSMIYDKAMNTGDLAKVDSVKDAIKFAAPIPLTIRDQASKVIDTDWDDPRSVAETLFGVGLGVAGFKANEMTATEKLIAEANKQYEEFDYGRTELSRRNQKFVKEASGGSIENDPLALAMFKKENPDMVPEPQSDSSKAYAAAREKRDEAFKELDKDFRAGKLTLRQFNEAVKEAKNDYRTRTEDIEFPDSKRKAGETPQDWVDGYFDIFDKATDGEEVDWDKFDREYQKLLSRFGDTRSERDAIDAYIDEYLMKDLPLSLREQKKAYNALDEAGYFDMKKYNLRVLEDDQAKEYQREVAEQVNLEWEARKDKNPKAAKPEFSTVASEYLKEEYGLSNSEIADVNRVNSGKKYWTPEYKKFREENDDLTVWFDQNATWSVIQAKKN